MANTAYPIRFKIIKKITKFWEKNHKLSLQGNIKTQFHAKPGQKLKPFSDGTKSYNVIC